MAIRWAHILVPLATLFPPVLSQWETPIISDDSYAGQVVMNMTAADQATAQGYKIVDLGYASYQTNLVAEGVASFLGIRYAAAPTGTQMLLHYSVLPDTSDRRTTLEGSPITLCDYRRSERNGTAIAVPSGSRFCWLSGGQRPKPVPSA